MYTTLRKDLNVKNVPEIVLTQDLGAFSTPTRSPQGVRASEVSAKGGRGVHASV